MNWNIMKNKKYIWKNIIKKPTFFVFTYIIKWSCREWIFALNCYILYRSKKKILMVIQENIWNHNVVNIKVIKWQDLGTNMDSFEGSNLWKNSKK